ncbi:hypothetical protein [Allokutzneria oryzae]|uniref:Uncharacterized protein n=1 Tax=Allokutzneria oryzae TaxID=1378989 RepID=A0ABV6A1F9_9PSEU
MASELLSAATGSGSMLDGFHTVLWVPLVGAVVTVTGTRRRQPVTTPEVAACERAG